MNSPSTACDAVTGRAHPAWRSWQQVCPAAAEGGRVTVIQEKARSGVYRLHQADRGGVDVIAKRGYAAKIAAEHAIYTHWLPHLPSPTVRCLGHLSLPAEDTGWLFVEAAAGTPYRPADRRHRVLMAQWLAAVHTAGAAQPGGAGLPDRGAACYRRCLEAACASLDAGTRNPVLAPADHRRLAAARDRWQAVLALWPRVDAACATLPQTLVHGDLLPKNMRVLDDRAGGSGVVVFDWEHAGWGPAIVDLVQSPASDGCWASPDLDRYHVLTRRAWPEVTEADWRFGAAVAQLLHLVLWLDGDARHLDASWATHVPPKLEAYQDAAARVLHELGWKP